MSLNLTSSSSLKMHKTEESDDDDDEELLMVPDMEAVPSNASYDTINPEAQKRGRRRRLGRNPVDKEYRRLKSILRLVKRLYMETRLLRNRVSAQQARERKKVYVSDLETRAKELQDTQAKLEENISTLTNENAMLRKLLVNARPKRDE